MTQSEHITCSGGTNILAGVVIIGLTRLRGYRMNVLDSGVGRIVMADILHACKAKF